MDTWQAKRQKWPNIWRYNWNRRFLTGPTLLASLASSSCSIGPITLTWFMKAQHCNYFRSSVEDRWSHPTHQPVCQTRARHFKKANWRQTAKVSFFWSRTQTMTSSLKPTLTSWISSTVPVKALSNMCKHYGRDPKSADPSLTERVSQEHSLKGRDSQFNRVSKAIQVRTSLHRYRNPLVTYWILSVWSKATQRWDQDSPDCKRQSRTEVIWATSSISITPKSLRAGPTASTTKLPRCSSYRLVQNKWWRYSTNHLQAWRWPQPWFTLTTLVAVNTESIEHPNVRTWEMQRHSSWCTTAIFTTNRLNAQTKNRIDADQWDYKQNGYSVTTSWAPGIEVRKNPSPIA